MIYVDGMFVEHNSSWLWSISENAHYSLTTCYIWMVFVEHHSSWLRSISENAHYSLTTRYIWMVCLLGIILAGCGQ